MGNNEKTIWLAGRVYSDNGSDEIPRWEVLGIYTTEELACARCRTANDFVGPLVLDEDLPEETRVWPGAYYPLGEMLLRNANEETTDAS